MKKKTKRAWFQILATAVITSFFTFFSSFYLQKSLLSDEQEYWKERIRVESLQEQMEKQILLMETINEEILTAEILMKELKVDAAMYNAQSTLSKRSGQESPDFRFEIGNKMVSYHKHLYKLSNKFQMVAFYFPPKVDSVVAELSNSLDKNYRNNFSLIDRIDENADLNSFF